MKNLITLLMTFLLGSVIVFGNLTDVYAQGSSEEEFTLEEITVTAEKRAVNVQDIAMSVSAISGADIRDRAQNTLEAALRDIASVELGYGNRGAWVNIRGVGHYVDTSLADSAVAIIEDNIYNGNSLASFGNMYDIDRVEVLRGPQGTLYGRNATGGTVNVISKKPTREFEMTGSLQIGDYNLKHFDGALNFPISEKWAGRIAVLRETRDGYLSSGDLDSNAFAARMKLLYEPNDRFSALATYEYMWQNDHGSNTVPAPGSAGNLPCLGPPDTCGYSKPDADRDGLPDDVLMPDADGNLVAGSDGIPDLKQTGWVVPAGADEWTNDEWHPAGSSYALKKASSVEINYDFDWGVLTAIPAYAESYTHNVDDHLDGLSQNTGVQAYDLGEGQRNSRKQTSGELRLASPSDSDWVWIGGYYYMKSDSRRVGMDERDATSWADDQYHQQLKSNPIVSSAFFGQTTYPVTDRFRVTGGIRFANDKEKRDFRIGGSYSTGEVFYDTGWVTYDSDVNSKTYKAGIEFDVAEASMLYAQIATGFKQGGLNTTAPPRPFKPEELTAYELGIKNRFLENRMQLNLEAYYYQYDNMQVQMPDQAPIGDTGAVQMIMAIINAEQGTNKGIDLEMDYLFTKNDKVTLALAYMDSELGHFVLPPNPFQTVPAPYDMTGEPFANAPKWAADLAYEHTWTLDNGATVTGHIDSKISAGYHKGFEYQFPYNWNESYHRSNANLTYATSDGKWSISSWIANIENGAQYTWAVPFYRQMIKPPRTFGMTVSFRY